MNKQKQSPPAPPRSEPQGAGVNYSLMRVHCGRLQRILDCHEFDPRNELLQRLSQHLCDIVMQLCEAVLNNPIQTDPAPAKPATETAHTCVWWITFSEQCGKPAINRGGSCYFCKEHYHPQPPDANATPDQEQTARGTT